MDNAVDGYARVITNETGKIISVEEWYNFDEKIHDYVTDVHFTDWIEDSDYKDSEVLITYKMWSDKTWTDYGYEYDCGLNVVDEILLGVGCKQKLIGKIEKMKKYLEENKDTHKKNNLCSEYSLISELDKTLGFDEIEFSKEIEWLISEFEERYDEEYEPKVI
jgi:hypothetical protein